MKQIEQADFRHYLAAAKAASGDSVYPCSIAEGWQSGDIFTAGDAVLFWHYCGFAYLSGNPDVSFLDEITARFFRAELPRRFLLISADPEICGYFAEHAGTTAEERVYYRSDAAPELTPLPEGFSLRRIDAKLLPRITGHIVPSFSWETPQQFLANGFGYCVMQGETVAACAFSAAVTSDAVDIGVETAEEYRQRGLAKIAASAVMLETLAQGKTPVWAHHCANTGSMHTALALGFRQTLICRAIR